MLRRSKHRRAGISLIELLVVIAIIAILMSLITAAAMRAMESGDRAKSRSRIDAVNKGVNTFTKGTDSFGPVNYIPPGGFDPATRTWGPFRLRNSYPATPAAGEPGRDSFEAQYLVKVFGRGNALNLDDLGFRDNANQPNLSVNLDANQTLTFFLGGIPEVSPEGVVLTGFSKNPQRPFSRRSRPDENRKGPLLDLPANHYAADPTNSFPRLLDSYGQPFAYFAARDGLPNTDYGGYNPLAAGVQPYTLSGQLVHPKTFQIISAGKDGAFGPGGDWGAVARPGEDDLTNFSTNRLGAGPN